MGGLSANGSATTSVERATIMDADGNISSFTDAGVALAAGRSLATPAVSNRYVYLHGGSVTDVQFSLIGSTGGLGTFTNVTSVLAVQRLGHASAVLGDSLYLIGGKVSSVERATLKANGTVGTFGVVNGATLSNTPTVPKAISLPGALLVIGGQDADSNATGLPAIQRASAP
jgi:hypothetical protein